MRDGTHSISGGLHLTINISGTLEEIRQKVLSISAVVQFRKVAGWAPYQPDETWLYESEQDDDVCPVCQGFEATQYFQGDALPTNFPALEQIDPLHFIRPRVHQDRTDLLGECRCTLDWIESVETLSNRLRQEMEEASE